MAGCNKKIKTGMDEEFSYSYDLDCRTREVINNDCGAIEQVKNGIKIGYRFCNDNGQFKGKIGQHAIDLCYSQTVDSMIGATGDYSYAIGYEVKAGGESSFASGRYTVASGNYSNATGIGANATGMASHAEGAGTQATAEYSHAEGLDTIAESENSHAEGKKTKAIGFTSHAQGELTEAYGFYSHAEGLKTKAQGHTSHAEGESTLASGRSSHTEGKETIASGENAHAEGYRTKARNDNMHVSGKYNVGIHTGTIVEVGVGTSDSNRKNAFEVYTKGQIKAPLSEPWRVNLDVQNLVPVSYLLSAEFGNRLPTMDPHVQGRLWNDAGSMKISLG